MDKNLRKTTDSEKEVFEYLNDLRDSGECNMFGAASYITADLGVDKKSARTLLSMWMGCFNPDGDYDEIITDVEPVNVELW